MLAWASSAFNPNVVTMPRMLNITNSLRAKGTTYVRTMALSRPQLNASLIRPCTSLPIRPIHLAGTLTAGHQKLESRATGASWKKKKKNEILAKNANMTQKHVTAVKRWSPLSFYCSALPDLSLVAFPGMSVSQPFPKGSGDNSVSSLVRMVDSLVLLYLISHIHPGYLC